MNMAIAAASRQRTLTSPNPAVGCAVVAHDGSVSLGATHPPGGPHAERVALDQCPDPSGATLYTTLEPCSHHGRTGPCTEAIVAAGVGRVVIGVLDPDPLVAGTGVTALREAGIEVEVGEEAERVAHQLRAYLHHRRTGRPWVVLKSAATLDGLVAAADGSSQWITGPAARADGHRIRAESDAIVVGAGTVRADDASLTVRDYLPDAHREHPEVDLNPRRVVLGSAPAGARVHPCLEWDGALTELLDTLGAQEVVQLMVEGGPTVAASFHQQGLVNEYVLYLAPAFGGGRDGVRLFDADGPGSIGELWRGRFADVERVGDDIRVQLFAEDPSQSSETNSQAEEVQ